MHAASAIDDAKTREQLEADVARMEAELAQRDAQLAELQEARDAHLAELNATRAELALCMVSPSPSHASEDTKNDGGDDGVSELPCAATTDGATDDRMVSRTAAAPTSTPRPAPKGNDVPEDKAGQGNQDQGDQDGGGDDAGMYDGSRSDDLVGPPTRGLYEKGQLGEHARTGAELWNSTDKWNIDDLVGHPAAGDDRDQWFAEMLDPPEYDPSFLFPVPNRAQSECALRCEKAEGELVQSKSCLLRGLDCVYHKSCLDEQARHG